MGKPLTAKEFDREFWQDNDPITTPLWKCMQAYSDYSDSFSPKEITHQDVHDEWIRLGVQKLKDSHTELMGALKIAINQLEEDGEVTIATERQMRDALTNAENI